MKILVTGAAGFIASHVVDALVGRGHRVVGLDSLDAGVHQGPPAYLRKDVEYIFEDLREWKPDARTNDVEAVVHTAALGGVSRAAKEPANIVGANCYGTARLLEAARGWKKLRRIVHASSFSIYGTNYIFKCPKCGTTRDASRETKDLDRGQFEVMCRKCGVPADVQPITEAAPPAPLETYGASKFMQELCFRGFDAAPVTLLRFSSVYGKRLRLDDGEATIIAKLAGWIRSGVRPKLYEDGKQIRDWVYVGDLVDAVVAVLDGKPAPAVINVCSGTPVTLVGACETLARAIGTSCQPEIVGGFRPGDMRHCLGDATNFAKLIGRKPRTLAEGAPLSFVEEGKPVCAGS